MTAPRPTFARPRAAALLVALAMTAASPAAAAERRFSVTGFDRVRIDGPYDVALQTGRAPFATASGDTAALDRIKLGVEGRTLVVRAASGGWGGYPGAAPGKVTIRVGTHDLSQAWINGAGVLAIDRVEGLGFSASVAGAGRLTIDELSADQVELALFGAASARLAGTAKTLTARISGTSALDSAGLSVKSLTLGVDGPSSVSARASDSARIEAAGPASIVIEGGAACTVKAAGSAAISGC